jgi:hypothetical protein
LNPNGMFSHIKIQARNVPKVLTLEICTESLRLMNSVTELEYKY